MRPPRENHAYLNRYPTRRDPPGAEGAHHTRAAKVLSMVFSFVAPTLLGIHPAKNQKPCLSELLPHRDATATPGRPQQPHTAHLLSLDFREMLHNNPHHLGSKSDKHGLSNPPPQTPWSRRARQGKTMLIQSATPPAATLRSRRRPPHKGSKSSKHGFYFYRPKSPGDSSGQKPKTMLI